VIVPLFFRARLPRKFLCSSISISLLMPAPPKLQGNPHQVTPTVRASQSRSSGPPPNNALVCFEVRRSSPNWHFRPYLRSHLFADFFPNRPHDPFFGFSPRPSLSYVVSHIFLHRVLLFLPFDLTFLKLHPEAYEGPPSPSLTLRYLSLSILFPPRFTPFPGYRLGP